MWTTIASVILGKVIPSLASFFEKKRDLRVELALRKLEVKIAREDAHLNRAARLEYNDHEWEIASIRNSGWKDEVVLIILSIPMVCVFIPGLQTYIQAGFTALDTTPLWYKTTVMSIYLATFGMRLWRRDATKGKSPININ
jgi:hypothetical protein